MYLAARSLVAAARLELLGGVGVRERLVGHRHTERGAQGVPSVSRLPLDQASGRDLTPYGVVVAQVSRHRLLRLLPPRIERAEHVRDHVAEGGHCGIAPI